VSRTEQFEEHRSLLFAIAYRILGSVGEAEDAVQDTWLRYETSTTEPRSPKAFLASVVTRVSINILNSARVRREQYVGEWFPEPLLEDPYQDPERTAELADSISMAALLLLERLSPLERAAFVLREVFGFGYEEVASTVERSEDACRQLVSRARRHLEAGKPRFEADQRVREELAARFFDAFKEGDVDGLRELLAADVLMAGDGGGKAPTLPKPVVGADPVSRVLAAVAPRFIAAGFVLEQCTVNGQPGALTRSPEGDVLTAMVLEIADGQIRAVRAVSNPDKLGHLGRLADVWEVKRQHWDRRSERGVESDSTGR
jgi:RNA polymerase sigma-70 factor (ECF subfamily)